jgi:hypothetical protein
MENVLPLSSYKTKSIIFFSFHIYQNFTLTIAVLSLFEILYSIEYISFPVKFNDKHVSPSLNCNGNILIPIKFERCCDSKLSASTARTP